MSTLYPGGDYPVTPNLGLALWDMSFEMAENMILIDTAVGSGASKVEINGSVISNPNFNNTTPAAPIAGIQALWQSDVNGNVSAYVTIPSALYIPDTTTLTPTSGGNLVTLQTPANTSLVLNSPSGISGDASLVLSAGLARLNGGVGGGVTLSDPDGGGIIISTGAAVSVTDTVGSIWNAATGGSKGAGTINALGLYVNGVAVSTGSSLWSGLGNAIADLTLANAGFNTTFKQTSATNWTWANTTAATRNTPTLIAGLPLAAVGGSVQTTAVDTTGAKLFVAVVLTTFNPDVPTDTGGNTWTQLTAQMIAGSPNSFLTVSYVLNPVTNVATKFKNPAQATDNGLYFAFTNVAAFGAFAGGLALSPGAVTTEVGDVIVTAFRSIITNTLASATVSDSIPNTYNGLTAMTSTAQGVGAAAYAIVTTAGATNPTWVPNPANTSNASIIVCFRASSNPQNSPVLNISGSYWSGIGNASATDTWSLSVVGSSIQDGPSVLTYSHTGTSGTASVSFPNVTVASGSILFGSDTTLNRTAAKTLTIGNGTAGNIAGILSLFAGGNSGAFRIQNDLGGTGIPGILAYGSTTATVHFGTYGNGIAVSNTGGIYASAIQTPTILITGGSGAAVAGNLVQTDGAHLHMYSTTAGTNISTNASPLQSFTANYWTGAVSALDIWKVGSSLAAGTNGASTLTFSHSGSSGVATIQVPSISITGILYDGAASAGSSTDVLTSTGTGIQWSATSSLTTNASKLQGVNVATVTPQTGDTLRYNEWGDSKWDVCIGAPFIRGWYADLFNASILGINSGTNPVVGTGSALQRIAPTGTEPVLQGNATAATGSLSPTCYIAWQSASTNPFAFGTVKRMSTRVQFLNTTTVRYFLGLFSNASTPPVSPATDTPNMHYAAFRYSAGTDTTIKAICGTATASLTIVDTGVAIDTAATHVFDIAYDGTNVNFYIDGVLKAQISTNLPSASDTVQPSLMCDNQNNAIAVGWRFAWMVLTPK